MERLNIGLTDQQRKGIVESLNKLLADEHVIYIKTRNFHWNVVGPRFHDLHIFLEKQYEQLAAIIDEVAENARMFGGTAAGSMKEFLKLTRLEENSGNVPDENGILQSLIDDHESIIRTLREDIEHADEDLKAADAADFSTSVLEQHNKMAWMLRSFLPTSGLATSGGKKRDVETKTESDKTLAGSHR
ncbi:MAG TPA: DNA starvation/stationary phase protection protein [Bryobacteraceae bacterium]|nr:DNA starvation/stationary phase protection protein [Bryobacteraceae bacterium]